METMQRTGSGRIDWTVVAPAASTGLTILVLGGLLQPIAARAVPAVGVVWLPAVAVVAFGVAGYRSRRATKPARHGAATAAGSYLLVLPLVVMAIKAFNPAQVLLTLVTAVVVGALSGHLAGRLCPQWERHTPPE